MATIDFDLGQAAVHLPTQTIPLLAPRRRTESKELTGIASEAINGVFHVLDAILREAVWNKSQEEFQRTKFDLFGRYAGGVLAASALARAIVPTGVAEFICSEILVQVETEFCTGGDAEAIFGKMAAEQVRFTTWSFRRTNPLVARIVEAPPVAAELEEKDRELARKYLASGLWSQFALDCLLHAHENKITIHPAVVVELVDGLRAAVDSYAWARQGFDLRFPEHPEDEIIRELDVDDELWLDFAAHNGQRGDVCDIGSDS